ncbi:MAG: hypothetical protein ACFE0Q_01660 [Anaerolineae bacterium]
MSKLSIHADLQVVIDDDNTIHVKGEGGQVLTCHLPSLGVAFSIWRRHGSILTPILKRLTGGLSTTGVTLELLVGDRQIARIGAEAKSGLLASLLRIAPAEIHIRNILHVLFN